MFIKFEDITDEILIDARTRQEFESMPLFDYNIPIINKPEHNKIKNFYPLAIPIILKGLYKRRRLITYLLLKYTKHNNKVVIGCSRGRLRSPILCLYARFIGIDAKILYKGIKRFYTN